MLKPLIIIPSRLGSTRLQEKALKIINGQPMICHVWSNALKADLGPVVVATDSAVSYTHLTLPTILLV